MEINIQTLFHIFFFYLDEDKETVVLYTKYDGAHKG